MKLEKKHYIIIGVVALIAIWYFFLRKKPTESNFKASTRPASTRPASTRPASTRPMSFAGATGGATDVKNCPVDCQIGSRCCQWKTDRFGRKECVANCATCICEKTTTTVTNLE